MPLGFLADGGYNAGMIRDESSWRLPAGAVYDQLNMLNDIPGIARHRGATTALFSGAQTAFATSLGICYSQDSTTIEELYGVDGKTGTLYSVNKASGAATSLGAAAAAGSVMGRPVRHFGALFFPCLPPAGSNRISVLVAGQTANVNFTSTSAVTITANAQQITLAGADTTANIRVGGIVLAADGPATTLYRARVVSVDSATKFTVWPRPPVGFVTSATGLCVVRALASNGGVCGTSFQNRLLYGNTNDLASTSQALITDRRVYYSPLPTEASTTATTQTYGATFMSAFEWPQYNWFEIPGADPIVAMEPISDGELLILTNTSIVIFIGNLTTFLGSTAPSVAFDIYPLGVTEGCLSDLSVQRTPVGIMWAGSEGVFAYWPPLRRNPAKTGVRNLCEGKILKYWLSLSGASDFAIHGAAYARNHYFISGFANGATFALACNLAGNEWTRLSGAGTDIFNGVRRPTNPSQTYALRWWNQTGAAPSMTNGQTVRLETMLDLYTPGTTKTDADGTAVPMSLTTRTITGDAETQKMFQRGIVQYQQSSSTAAVAVTAQSTLDAADTDASRTRALGNLSSTATSTITNATNATPIVVTTSAAHGLQTDDFVDIDAVLGNLNANGQYRINVTSTTQFSLVGSSGSAAYTSGGRVKKRTEQTFQMSPLNKGQGASLTVSGSPNNFELHGVKFAVLQQEPVPA